MMLEPWIVEAALARFGATDPQRTGNRAEGYPNTEQGPVARLVGRYTVRLIGRLTAPGRP